MEGYLAEIRLFAGNFAPRGWALCDGQMLAISSNQALFSLLGCNYGGDCRTTFALPDLRGRAAMGIGMGPGLRERTLAQQVGYEDVTLTLNQLPSHNHSALIAAPTFIGKVKPSAYNGKGTQVSDPTGAFMADSPGDLKLYSAEANTKMGPSAVSITEKTPGGATINTAGGSQSHNNMQPSTVLNYIICTQGLFPSRN